MGIKSEILQSNIIVSSGKNISAVIALLFSVVMGRMLGPYDYGLFSFCMVVVSFSLIFTNLGINMTLTRFISSSIGQNEFFKAGGIVRLLFKYKVFLTILISFIILLFPDYLAANIFNKPEAANIVFFAGFVLIFHSFFDFFYDFFLGVKNFYTYSIIHVSQQFFKFIFATILVYLGFGVTGAIYALFISYILILVYVIFTIKSKHNFVFSSKKIKTKKKALFNFGIWVFLSTVVGGAYGIVDQVMISMLLGVTDIGYYRISVSWMFAITYLLPISAYAMYPYFSSSQDKKILASMVQKSIKYAAMFVFPAAFLLSAFSTIFIQFLYGENFLEAGSILRILSFVAIPLMMTILIATFFSGIKRPDVVGKITSILILLNVLLNYFMIPLYGAEGAAIATLISKSLELAILLWVLRVVIKIKFSVSNLWRPLVSALGGYLLISLFSFHSIIESLFFGIVFVIVYSLLMYIVGGIAEEELNYLRKGFQLAKKRLKNK
jgi:O-antigen/teichoic acid export membrane protein